MTKEEAIRRLKRIADNEAYADKFQDACRLAVAALEKQLPRKPQDKFSTHAIIDNGEYIDNIDFMTFECPVCNGVLASGEIEKEDCTNIHYCENCGQAIDWSDT